MRRLAALLALLTIFAAAGCAAAGAIALADRDFVSVNVTDGGAARPLVAGTQIRLHFGASDMGASAGCNSIGGTYRIDGGRLIFEGAGMTEMACDPQRDAQDTWLVEFLGSNPAIRLTGDELTLERGSVVIRLLDRKVVEPDAALAGPTWTVVSIITGDAVSSIPAGATATLVFNADGSLTFDAGCNQGGGRWVAAGSGLDISEIALTKKACDGVAGQLEAAVLAVLGARTVGAGIDGNTLTLQAGANGLQLQAS